MMPLSQALLLGYLSSPHSAFQEHAAHTTRWPVVLSSKDSQGTCIPCGVATFLFAAFTAHSSKGSERTCILQGLTTFGFWGATEQETGVSQRSASQNSYFLRKKAAYGGMGSYSFAKVSCKSQNLCDNFCKSVDVNY